jgi:hypothetical protein
MHVYDHEQGVSYPLTPASLIYGRRIATTPNESHYEIVSTNKSLTKVKSTKLEFLKTLQINGEKNIC